MSRALDLELKYPAALLAARARVAESGSFRERVRYDLVERPPYAFGLLAAADVARFAGVERIVAVEFGVAEGAGLRNLASLAAPVTSDTGVDIDVVGFDSGVGLPPPLDHRDHPEIWAGGDFAMGDASELEAQLPVGTDLVLGPVAETVPEFAVEASAPVGFVSFDLDYYSSTRDALALFDLPADRLLPVVVCYFDDVLGGAARIGSLFRNDAAGQLLAIREFNERDASRWIDAIRILRQRRPMDREPWLDRMYGLHVLDHPLRAAGSVRSGLSMADHGRDRRYDWPL